MSWAIRPPSGLVIITRLLSKNQKKKRETETVLGWKTPITHCDIWDHPVRKHHALVTGFKFSLLDGHQTFRVIRELFTPHKIIRSSKAEQYKALVQIKVQQVGLCPLRSANICFADSLTFSSRILIHAVNSLSPMGKTSYSVSIHQPEQKLSYKTKKTTLFLISENQQRAIVLALTQQE